MTYFFIYLYVAAALAFGWDEVFATTPPTRFRIWGFLYWIFVSLFAVVLMPIIFGSWLHDQMSKWAR